MTEINAPTINKPAIREWIKALRSGDYQQGKGYLVVHPSPDTQPRYCCLGVACHIFAETLHLVEGELWFTNDTEYKFAGFLPPEVANYLGIDENPAVYLDRDDIECYVLPTHVLTLRGDGSVRVTLTALNDNQKLPFSDIADIVEKYILKEKVDA